MSRSLLSLSLAWLALASHGLAQGEARPAPNAIRLGKGAHTYAWVPGFGQLPEGEDLGNTHGCIVIDKAGRIYANTDTERAVVIFAPDGAFLGAWGKEFAGGLHGMTLVVEDGVEYLWLAHTGRHEVVKATLEGEVLGAIGWPEAAGIYASKEEYRPTSVAVAPNGDVYVADGYGKSWIHQYDRERRYVRSFGGPGKEPGRLQCPHGISIDSRGEEPVLIVADRENHRLQTFGLDGKHLGVVEGALRRPCNVHAQGEYLVVADLAGRVTILDGKNELLTHLGENPDEKQWANNGVPRAQWQDGVFIAPHGARFDADGNLYVMDWVREGRLTKLQRVGER